MKQHPTYRLLSSYLLLFLVLWTSKGQAMGKINCCCSNQNTTLSCCTVKENTKKECSRAKKGCNELQLSSCSCNQEAQWQPLLSVEEKALESSFISVLPLPCSSWKVTILPRAICWEVLRPFSLRQYLPPLLYKDVPIFVQSFLL